jgi:hypothetical protein
MVEAALGDDMLRFIRGHLKTLHIMGGFLAALIGALWGFLVGDRLSDEQRRLTDQKDVLLKAADAIENAAQHYFFLNQQGDMIYILGNPATTKTEAAVSMYRGNLLDRQVPVNSMILALGNVGQLDYKKTHDAYVALNQKAQDDRTFASYRQLKNMERDIVQKGQNLEPGFQNQFFDVLRRLSANDADQKHARLITLIFTIIGAMLVMFANLLENRAPAD